MAKPIIDLAAGIHETQTVDAVTARLEADRCGVAIVRVACEAIKSLGEV